MTPGQATTIIRPTWQRIGPLIAWAFAIAVGIVGVLVTLYARRGGPNLQDALWAPSIAVAFTTVGAVIVTQRAGNTIGRLCLTIGVLLGLNVAFTGIAAFIDSRPGPMPPLFVAFAVISGPLQWSGLALIAVLLARFPSGRLPSRRWRSIDVIVGAFLVAVWLTIFFPGHDHVDWILPAENPLGILLIRLPAEVAESLYVGLLAIAMPMLAAFVLSAAALVQTYRRSDRQTRAQIRWVLASVVLFVVALIPALLGVAFSDVALTLAFFAPVAIPVGIGIAILRYHLYDIDRIVSRTISYALVTAVLATTFIGVNLALQTFLAPYFGDDTVFIAMSTLLAAALFAPLRGRVQGIVDRRFNRARYDAEQTAASLADQLRDEVDITALRSRTLTAVTETVEPTSAGLWLRGT